MRSYFKSYFIRKEDIFCLLFPPSMRLFKEDDVLIYTNILTSSSLWLIDNDLYFQALWYPNSPIEYMIQEPIIFMLNNVFKFLYNHCNKAPGKYMVTTPARPYDTNLFAIQKYSIQDVFKNHLTLYHWFIDKVIGLWTPTPVTEKDIAWYNFQASINE